MENIKKLRLSLYIVDNYIGYQLLGRKAAETK